MQQLPRLNRISLSRRQLTWLSVSTGATLLAIGAWTQARLGDQLLPHAFCLSASQPLLLLHLVADALIAFAYLLIPWAMLNFARKRRDLPFGWIAWVFGAFIVACGVTHLLGLWTLYYPVYWYAGVAKAFTAAVSLGTAWLIYRLTPMALALPSGADLRRANALLQEQVHARERAEAELAQAHARLRELLAGAQSQAQRTTAVLDNFFQEAPVGLGLIGVDGRIERVNPTLLAGSGRRESDYLGARPADLPGIDGRLLGVVETVAAGGPVTSVLIERSVGEMHRKLHCTVFGIPLGASQRMCGVVVQDVSAEHDLSEQRTRLVQMLEKEAARKDTFIAVLAHELRNPLAPIKTSAAILERLGDDRVRRSADVIRRQVRHMARLLNDLLDVSRIVRGKLDVRLARIDLSALSRQVAHDHEEVFAGLGIPLSIESDQQELWVCGDQDRISQAVGNYLNNAAKFANGTQVRLVVRVDQQTEEAVVRVEDKGVGIDPALADRLFKPFEQGQQDLARTQGGLGLGLAIVSGIAELHGGRVVVESAGPGQGAAFELRLPLVVASQPCSS